MACCVDLTNGEKVGSCGTPAPGMKIKVNYQRIWPELTITFFIEI